MASYVFNKFKSDLMQGLHNLSAANDVYKVALVVASAAGFSAITTAADITATWNTLSATWDISNTSAYNSTNYSQVGLSGCGVTPNYGTEMGQWSASNVTWQNATIDTDGCVIYKDSNGAMVCAIDFGTKKSSSNGDFTIQWNSSGILDLS